jgi:two-component system, NarL family, response regulator DegU
MECEMYLSEREREILLYVCKGLSDKEIAFALGISKQTVKNHLRGIYRKNDLSSRTQAAIKAVTTGVINISEVKPNYT